MVVTPASAGVSVPAAVLAEMPVTLNGENPELPAASESTSVTTPPVFVMLVLTDGMMSFVPLLAVAAVGKYQTLNDCQMLLLFGGGGFELPLLLEPVEFVVASLHLLPK